MPDLVKDASTERLVVDAIWPPREPDSQPTEYGFKAQEGGIYKTEHLGVKEINLHCKCEDAKCNPHYSKTCLIV